MNPPSTKHPKHTRGLIEVALAGLCFGFLGVFGKLAYRQGFTVGELLTERFLVATTIFGLGLLVLAPQKLKIEKRQIPICAALGIFGYAVFSTLYFTAIEGVSVALASLLLYTYPVLVAAGARVFLNERLTRIQKAALPLVAVGLVCLLWHDLMMTSGPNAQTVSSAVTSRAIAILAGLGSALSYAAYILISGKLQKSVDPLSSSFYVMLFSALALLAFHRPDLSKLTAGTPESLGVIVGIAVVCTVFPLTLFLSGLQKLGNTEASLLSTIEPVTAAVVGSLALGETLMPNEILGGSIVLSALLLVILGSRNRERGGEKNSKD
jgi:drug/metabolite transporter (DMT)-like permease